MDNFGTKSAVIVANAFAKDFNELGKLLAVSSYQQVANSSIINIYDWSTDLKTTQVGKGEEINKSSVNRVARQIQMTMSKFYRDTAIEDGSSFGDEVVFSQADDNVVGAINREILQQLTDALATDPSTATGENLQSAIANGLGVLASDPRMMGRATIAFVNPVDYYAYVGTLQVQPDASNVLGATLIQNFLGVNTIMLLSTVPSGTVYVTASNNLTFVTADLRKNSVIGLSPDAMFDSQNGIIAIARETSLHNGTIGTLYVYDAGIFPQYANGVVAAKVSGTTTTTTTTTKQ